MRDADGRARARERRRPPASSAFSASRAVRETSPRTSRAYVFSSRSSASMPAASRRATNMSETVTAMATA